MTDPSTTTASLELRPRDGGGLGPGGSRLVAVAPHGIDLILPLGTSDLVLGRQSTDTPTGLDDRTISRRHLAISRDSSGSAIAMDLGSRNGSFLDGARMQERQPQALAHNSVIRLGRHLFVFEEDVPPPAQHAVSINEIPGISVAAQRLRTAIAHCASDPSPVLVLGETGVGKDRVSREIHRLSGRRGPLLAINCAELNAQLIESQLFGHVRGAFTGAIEAQPGLFRAADAGTLFLDEIGELPLELQATLLRAIEEGEVRPVGSTRTFHVDVRVIAATHQDLYGRVERGEFRRDLYARLALWEVRVPPLRQRRADVLAWFRRLFTAWRDERGLDASLSFEVDIDAAELLLLNDWSLNLRGVARIVHQLAPGSRGRQKLDVGAIADALGLAPPPARAPFVATQTPAPVSSRPAPPESADELVAVLEATGSVRAAARHYQRDRRQIYRWIDRFGVKMPG